MLGFGGNMLAHFGKKRKEKKNMKMNRAIKRPVDANLSLNRL